MSYYSAQTWWDTRYKLRRPVSLTPDSLEPGAETLCAVKLNRQPLEGKVKSDYSDLVVVYQGDQAATEPVAFYVVEESDTVASIVFEPKFPIALETDQSYYLYYGAKSNTRLENASDILDSTNLTLEDFGQWQEETSNTRWTFQKPTVFWTGNTASQADARALFEFDGHKVDFYFKEGPNFGQFQYQVNEGEKILVDCYSDTESSSKIVSVDSGSVGNNKIRIIVLDQRNAASDSSTIEIVKAQYHKILLGTSQPEEFFSESGKAYPVGS